MLGFDTSGPINCQLWIIFELIFSSLSFAAASMLIVVRIIAIWNGNRLATAIAICAWSTNVAFLIHNIILLRAAWVPAQSVCEVLNTESTIQTVVATLVTDVVLLLTVLVGLLRLRPYGTVFGVGNILWKQGLIWLFLATVAEVLPAVFLNNELDLVGETSPIQCYVSSSGTYRDVNHFDADTSLFDRLHVLWVFRDLSDSEGTLVQYKSQTDVLGTNRARPGGGRSAHVLRELSAGDNGSIWIVFPVQRE
ncbi:hypothetical protein V8E53_000254 [Lactarius tabidus]